MQRKHSRKEGSVGGQDQLSKETLCTKRKRSLVIHEGRSSKVEEEERKLTAATTAWLNRELVVRRVVATRSTEKDPVERKSASGHSQLWGWNMHHHVKP
jgi:hypothetical protein